MSLFESLHISATGMTANRLWLDLIANNVANINSTGTPGDPNNKPYRRQAPVFRQVLRQQLGAAPAAVSPGLGVRVSQLVQDAGEPRLVYDPDHPDAHPETGYVAYPNINILNEMVNMLAATRAYEANVTAFEAAKQMYLSALEMGR